MGRVPLHGRLWVEFTRPGRGIDRPPRPDLHLLLKVLPPASALQYVFHVPVAFSISTKAAQLYCEIGHVYFAVRRCKNAKVYDGHVFFAIRWCKSAKVYDRACAFRDLVENQPNSGGKKKKNKKQHFSCEKMFFHSLVIFSGSSNNEQHCLDHARLRT